MDSKVTSRGSATTTVDRSPNAPDPSKASPLFEEHPRSCTPTKKDEESFPDFEKDSQNGSKVAITDHLGTSEGGSVPSEDGIEIRLSKLVSDIELAKEKDGQVQQTSEENSRTVDACDDQAVGDYYRDNETDRSCQDEQEHSTCLENAFPTLYMPPRVSPALPFSATDDFGSIQSPAILHNSPTEHLSARPAVVHEGGSSAYNFSIPPTHGETFDPEIQNIASSLDANDQNELDMSVAGKNISIQQSIQRLPIKERMSENDAREQLADWAIIRFEKMADGNIDDNGYLNTPTWETVIRTEVKGIPKHEVSRFVRQLNLTTKAVLDKKSTLNPAQQRQLEIAQQQLQNAESDQRYHYELAQIDHQLRKLDGELELAYQAKVGRRRSLSSRDRKQPLYERISLTAYFKRIPKPMESAIAMFIEREHRLSLQAQAHHRLTPARES